MITKTAIVTTTINIPTFLEDICSNAKKYEHKLVSFIVIGDKKTPPEIYKFCDDLNKKYGYLVEYYDLNRQEDRLKSYSDLLSIIPYNSGARKLLGNLIAYQDGYDTVIQIDDDNFIGESDFISEHNSVGITKNLKLFKSNDSWHNIYSELIEENNIPFFPRGFPWGKRDYNLSSKSEIVNDYKKIVLINGLVFEDPDIDAISRLFWPIRVVGTKENINENFGLYPGTWSSFNNQNTSTCRELTSVYFTPVCVGRNSDIWTSFVMCKLTEVAGDVIAFGAPYVKQLRNEHNLWDDLKLELENNILTDYFVNLLKEAKIKKDKYLFMLLDLIDHCIKTVDLDKDLSDNDKSYIIQYFKEYKIWADCFK